MDIAFSEYARINTGTETDKRIRFAEDRREPFWQRIVFLGKDRYRGSETKRKHERDRERDSESDRQK